MNLSAFEKRCLGALELAGRILGEADFTIDGVPGTCRGVFNEFSEEREIDDDTGGAKVSVSGVIVCPISQFTRQKPARGRRVKIHGRELRVAKLDEDSISFTLWLGHLSR